MGSNAKMNKRERMSRNEMIAKGLAEHCPKAVILNDGDAVKAAEAIKLFDAASVAEKKVLASRAQYLADVAAAQASNAKAKVLVAPIKTLVAGMFGKTSAIVAEFGFGPEGNRPTVETRLEAVEKLRATRAARGTKGSRQAAAIHGEVSAAGTPAPSQPVVATSTNGSDASTQAALLSLGSSH